MNRVWICTLVLLTYCLSACNARVRESKEISEAADEMDSIVRTMPVLDPANRMKAEDLIEEYSEFATNYPDDTLSPQYLMKASFLAGVIAEMDRQTELLEQVAETYPKSAYAPQALALAAKSYADNKKDYDKARQCLEKLQKDYPESPYSVNIDLQIEYIGDDDGLFEATMQRRHEIDSVNAVEKGAAQ